MYEALVSAFGLLLAGDPGLWEIIFVSLRVSLTAVAIGSIMGIGIGVLLALTQFRGKALALLLVNTFMGLPPVIVGLAVFMFLSRQGPLGQYELLFTPLAMILAQIILVTPIVAGLTYSAVRSKDAIVRETASSLGASSWQVAMTIIKEAKIEIMGAIVSGFGRAIAEVGAVMLVGGNIKGMTRVLTTAIVLETRKGEFELGIALGLVLLLIAFVVNVILRWLQGEKAHGRL